MFVPVKVLNRTSAGIDLVPATAMPATSAPAVTHPIDLRFIVHRPL
jgi:hypothetical protein